MSFLAPKNKYHQDQAKLDTTNYGGTIGQSAANAQTAYGQQQQVQGALGQTAAGKGPNPAQEMLRQQTSQNVNQAAGQAASARSVNPALAARMAVDSGAQMNQQAAGQGATMQAQQSLAAQNAMMQNAQAMQQGQMGMFGSAGQLQNAQNQANIANTLGTGQINAGVSAQNAQMGAQMVGGVLNAGGAAAGMALASEGGEIVPGGVRRYAGGGPVEPPRSLLHQYMDSLNGLTARPQALAAGGTAGFPGPAPAMIGDPGFDAYADAAPQRAEAMQAAADAPPAPAGKRPAFGEPFKGDGGLSAYQTFAHMRTPGLTLAHGGQAFDDDGFVPGQAEVPGDDERNDEVPAMLSPGEIVIPRSIAQSPDAPQGAAQFVAHLMRRKGQEGDGFDRVLQARQGQYAEGGVAGQAQSQGGPPPEDNRLAEENERARVIAQLARIRATSPQTYASVPRPVDEFSGQSWAPPKLAEGGQVLQDPATFVRRPLPPDEPLSAQKRPITIPGGGLLPVYTGETARPGEKEQRSKARPRPQHFDEGGEVEQAQPGFVDAVTGWWAARGTPAEDAAREAVVEAAHAALPDSLSGREAVLKKRAQQKQIDDASKE